jgi:hypothetical protein
VQRYTFFIPDQLRAALQRLKDRDGIPESVAIRRALAEHLTKQGIPASEFDKRTPAARKKR